MLTAFAVIAVTLGLTAGAADASVASAAKPVSSATATTVTKIHETKCTSTTLSIRYDKGKKVACYTGQGFEKVALPEATQATAGSSGGFLLLKEGSVPRIAPFFPRERLPLAPRTEVTGIALSSLHVTSPKADSADQGTRISGTAAYTVDVTGGNVSLTAASDADAALINYALTAGLQPEGGACHASPWYDPLKWYCEWTFTHAQSEAIITKALTGAKAAVALVCYGFLHKYVGPIASAVCAIVATFLDDLKKIKLAKDQCLYIKVYTVPPRPGKVGVVKC